MMKPTQAFLGATILLLLTACGFHLRGHSLKDAQFAFRSIYIKAPAETPLVAALRRVLGGYKLAVMDVPGQADLTLDIVSEADDKRIIALNASGHVIEYILYYRVSLRAYDRQQNEWLPATEIALQRDFPYDDSQVLAKEQEERLLYQDMRMDAAQQVSRRLSFAKPPQPENP